MSVGKTSRHVKALPVAFAHGLKPLWSQLYTRSTYNLFDLHVKVAQCCVCHALKTHPIVMLCDSWSMCSRVLRTQECSGQEGYCL